MSHPSDFFMDYLYSHDSGRIILVAGSYEWKVPTKRPPHSVSITEVDSGSIQVCQGSNNLYGVTLHPDGFILHAEVRSDKAEIAWHAHLENK